MDKLLQAEPGAASGAPATRSALPVPAVVIGGGPAGLMAAEALSAQGIETHVFDAMPSVGRKFLLAGIGGLNLTHSDPQPKFLARYGAGAAALEPAIRAFNADALRAWALALGIPSFVGSSGRVFPEGMKAAPLLRAWLHRLRANGVKLHPRHRWLGWDDGNALRFQTPAGETTVTARAVVLALGGASWAKLGSDGAWVPWLAERGVEIAPLQPANCGFEVAGGWSEHLQSRHAGQALKPLRLAFPRTGGSGSGSAFDQQGECIVTQWGLEGGLIYAASAAIRDAIRAHGSATIMLDLLPGHSAARVQAEVAHARGKRSLASHLQSRLGLTGVKVALLHECLPKHEIADPALLAQRIKALPVTLGAARPLDEAISTGGGVRFESLNDHLMLRGVPGVFCAGEMLDWEAPTGGYLLTACFATGRAAGEAAGAYLSL